MKRSILLSAVFALATTGAGLAKTPTYDAATFYKTTDYLIASPDGAYSPDGGKLLITNNSTGVFNAYALDLKTGEQEALTNSDTNAVFAVSYFPDGERFLYTFDQGGNELNHLYVGGAGEPTDLTPGEKVKASFVGWTDDRSAFFVESNERDERFFDLYRYDADDFDKALVFQNDLALSGFEVSRDGAFAAGIKPDSSANSNIYLVPLNGGEPRLITEHEGDISYDVYEFTPESDALVFGTDEHGEFSQAWTHTIATGEKAPLIEADWDVLYVTFSPSGRYQVSALNYDASTAVTILDRETGEKLALPKGLPRGDLQSVRFSSGENRDRKSVV
ncbi:MAG: hypothetical protein RIC52_17230, partial [Amphiplicatus sp.]